MPSKVQSGLWAIKVMQSEIKLLCHTVYIRLLLLLFLETKSTLDWPIALPSRYAARDACGNGASDYPRLWYPPVLQCCCYLGLSQLIPSWSVESIGGGSCFQDCTSVVLREKTGCTQRGCCPDSYYLHAELLHGATMYQHGFAKLGEIFQLNILLEKKKRKIKNKGDSATLKCFLNWYLLCLMLSTFCSKMSFMFLHI